jgi:hypothetical protein
MHGPMKYFLAIFLCLWVSCAYAASSSGENPPKEISPASTSQEVPSMEISEPTFSFGETVEGEEVIHDFRVKNNGKAALQIDQVRPG